MTQPFYTGVVKKKPKDVKLIPCGIAWTYYCPCGAFQIALAEELNFGAARCSKCGVSSQLDVENAQKTYVVKPKK